MKQEATMKNWSLSRKDEPFKAPELIKIRLQGNVYGHPAHSDGTFVRTSSIVKVDDREDCKLVYTKNTIYKITADDVDSEYEKLYPEAYNRLPRQARAKDD